MSNWKQWGRAGTTQPGYGRRHVQWDTPSSNANGTDVLTAINAPSQAGADKTGSNTANDVKTGTGKAVAESGADKTAANLCSAGSQIVEGVCYDGVAYTFAQAFNATPIIIFGAGGLSYDSTLTGSQCQSFTAESVTATSFTPRLKIQELSGTTTDQSQNFSPYNTYGASASLTLSAAAWDGNYTINFTGEAYAGFVVAKFQILMDGTVVWSKNLIGGNTSTRTQSYSVTLTNTALASGQTVEVKMGNSNGQVKATTMTYQTATAPTVHTATPSGAAGVPFTAYPPT